MADQHSTEYKARYVTLPASMASRNKQDLVKTIYAKWDLSVAAASVATSDTVYLAKIPKGARVIDAIVKHGDLGTGGTVDIGWQASADGLETADADGIFAALDVQTAADALYAANSVASPPAVGKEFVGEVNVVLVPSQNINPGTSGTLELFIQYV